MSARPLVLAALTLGLALASCSPPPTARDVAYYKGHAAERGTELASCQNDPGGLGKTPNCVNALRADGEAVSEKAWAIPKTPPRVHNPGQL